jgi:SAM-dependent methyltransferase
MTPPAPVVFSPPVTPCGAAAAAATDPDGLRCPSCGGRHWRAVRRIRRRWLAQCTGCFVLRTLPPPADEAQDFADGSGANFRQRHESIWRDHATAQLRELRRLLADPAGRRAPDAPAPRLLDIGASIGTLVAVAREQGWEATGIEPDGQAQRIAVGRGIPVEGRFFGRGVVPPASYDAVVASHVVEHVADPVEFLSAIHDALRPGGVALLVCPCPEGLPARVLGRWWFGYVEEQHRWHFTPSSLAGCAGLAGLAVAVADLRRTLHHESAPLGPLLPLVRLFLWASRAFNRGDELWLVARRPLTGDVPGSVGGRAWHDARDGTENGAILRRAG